MRIQYPGTTAASLYTLDYLPSGARDSVTGIGPHARTQRSYTYRSSTRMMIIKSISLMIQRVTTATTAGQPYIEVSIETNNLQPHVIRLYQPSNTANNIVTLTYQCEIEVMRGQGFFIYTADNSTGGTLDYYWWVYYADLIMPQT